MLRKNSMSQMTHGDTRGFPLAALFLLTALCAILAALLMQVARAVGAKEMSLEGVLIASTGSSLVGAVLGGLLGLAQRGPLVGWLVGSAVGFLIGSIVGPVCLLNVDRVAGIMGISLGGAVLLVVVAIVTRFVSRREARTAE